MKVLSIIIVFITLMIAGCGGKDESKNELYYCPMHPEVTDTKPGVCPICKMDLVLKGSTNTMSEGSETEGGVHLDSAMTIAANVSVYTVKEIEFKKVITAYSRLAFTEQSQKTISARFNGRIEKLYIEKTGDYAYAGKPLFDFYSPDILQAQNELLIGVKSMSPDNSLIEAAKNRLILFGITESQIDEIIKTGKSKNVFTYYSPYSGVVVEKNITEGEYINTGNKLYTLADFSTLWNIADVNENDAVQFTKGSGIKFILNNAAGDTIYGKVDYIYPVVDEQNRTVKVRTLISNKNNKLKPNMTGMTILEKQSGKYLGVPSDAVIITGKKNIVYVREKGNHFVQREVILGEKADNYYRIISGLKAGEVVASSGGFLIDSESQLTNNSNK